MVSKSDEGFYECTATSKVGATRARSYISVSGGTARAKPRCPRVSGSMAAHGLISPRCAVFAEPPPRLIAPGNITASLGQDVVMSCPVLSNVPYNLTWSWDGKAAEPGGGRTRLLQNRSLEISGVRPEDGGLYECMARSAHGTAAASLWLFVQGRLCPTQDTGPGDASAHGRAGSEWHPGLSPSPTLCRGTVGEGRRQPPAFQQGPGAAAELHGRGPPPAPHRLEALGLGAGAGREVPVGTWVPSSSLSHWGWCSPGRDAWAEGEGLGVARSSGEKTALQ